MTNQTDLIEIYKIYIADLGNIGSRYVTANGFYLSIVSAMLGIMAFAKGDELFGKANFVVTIAIPLFGCVICWIWLKTLDFFNTLFAAKFSMLRSIEAHLDIKCFTTEDEFLQKIHAEKKLPIRLIPIERKVPIVLAILFIGITITSIGANYI